MKKVSVLSLLMLAAVGVFAGGTKDAGGLTIKKGVLMVGTNLGYRPFEYVADDGVTPVGFDIQMAESLAKKLGLKLEIVDTAFDGIFSGVETGKYDCIIGAVTITPSRLAAHNFTKPYIGNAMALVTKKDSKVTAKTPQDLGGLQVAYQAETTADIYMEQLAAQGLQFTPREYDTIMNAFSELQTGRVDAVMTDSVVAVDYVSDPASPFTQVWKGPADEKFGICLKKGNDALTSALNKALDELFADGTMAAISQNIFNADLVSDAR